MLVVFYLRTLAVFVVMVVVMLPQPRQFFLLVQFAYVRHGQNPQGAVAGGADRSVQPCFGKAADADQNVRSGQLPDVGGTRFKSVQILSCLAQPFQHDRFTAAFIQ